MTFRIFLSHHSLILLFIIHVKATVTSLKSLNQPELHQWFFKKNREGKVKKVFVLWVWLLGFFKESKRISMFNLTVHVGTL